MGSGSRVEALKWSAIFGIVAVMGAGACVYLAKTYTSKASTSTGPRMVAAICACAVIAFLLTIVVRNIFGTPLMGVVMGLAFVLPALMSLRIGKTP